MKVYMLVLGCWGEPDKVHGIFKSIESAKNKATELYKELYWKDVLPQAGNTSSTILRSDIPISSWYSLYIREYDLYD